MRTSSTNMKNPMLKKYFYTLKQKTIKQWHTTSK